MDNRTTIKTAMETMLCKVSLGQTFEGKTAKSPKYKTAVRIGLLNDCKIYDLFVDNEFVYTAAVQGEDFKPFTFTASPIAEAFEAALKERIFN